MREEGMTAKAAIQMIQKKRRAVYLNEPFYKELTQYEKALSEKTSENQSQMCEIMWFFLWIHPKDTRKEMFLLTHIEGKLLERSMMFIFYIFSQICYFFTSCFLKFNPIAKNITFLTN